MNTANSILSAVFLLRILLSAMLAVLAACNGTSGSPSTAAASTQGSITGPGFSISISGFSDVQFVPMDASQTNLALTTNIAGATVNMRFSCESCDLRISSPDPGSGAIATANQDIPLTFATLDAGSGITLQVEDIGIGASYTYRLLARPADAVAYRYQSSGMQEPGDFYVTPGQFSGAGASTAPSYAYIIGNDGALKYYRRNPAGFPLLDFKKNILRDGSIRYSFYDGTAGAIRTLDENFNPLETIAAIPLPGSDAQYVDPHDHIVIDDRHYVLATSENRTVANIPSRARIPTTVTAFDLEEIRNGLLRFAWISSDHPELFSCSTEGNAYGVDNYADYFHFNSVMIDAGGNFIVSSRHLDAVMKINRSDGSIAWMLGGPCDQFGLQESSFSRISTMRAAPLTDG